MEKHTGKFYKLVFGFNEGDYTIIGLIESRFAVWMVEKITGTKVQIEGHKDADE